MYFGYRIAFGEQAKTVTRYEDLTDAIQAIQPEETGTFFQQLMNMFSVVKPKVDPTLLSETMAQWKTFWLLPTYMSAVIAILFFLLFWDKMKTTGDDDPLAEK